MVCLTLMIAINVQRCLISSIVLLDVCWINFGFYFERSNCHREGPTHASWAARVATPWISCGFSCIHWWGRMNRTWTSHMPRSYVELPHWHAEVFNWTWRVLQELDLTLSTHLHNINLIHLKAWLMQAPHKRWSITSGIQKMWVLLIHY